MDPGWFTPTPPPGASNHPGHLTTLPARTTPTTGRDGATGGTGSGTKKAAAPPIDRPAGTRHTGLIAALIAIVVILAAVLVVVARRRRSPALAAGVPPGATAFRPPTPTPAPADPESTQDRAEKPDRSPTGRPPEVADRRIDDQGANDQGAVDLATVDPATAGVRGEEQAPVIPARPVLVLPDPVTPPVPVPSVRVLGHVRVDGFVDLPAQGPLVDLLVFLALHPGRAFLNDTLRGRLAEGDETEVSEQTMQSYVSRLRRHLPAGVELVYSRSGYRLVGVTTDLTVFDELAATTPTSTVTPAAHVGVEGEADLEAIASVSAALALIEGEPFETETAPRWITDENCWADIQKKTAAAARRLDALASPSGAYERALWGYHQALIADPDDQALAADALTVAHRHPRPGTLVHEWDETVDRLAAAGQKPSADLLAHYERLRRHPPA